MITFPPKFTAGKLKQIARLCGKSRSGTKAVITDRIVGELADFRPLAPGTRVLSIDLGIRNLAYSLLEVTGSDHDNLRKTRRGGKARDSASATPILRAWERLALIPKTVIAAKSKTKAKSKGKKSAVDEESLEDATLTAADLTSATGSATGTTKAKTKTTKKGKKSSLEDGHVDQRDNALLAAAEADPTATAIPIEDFSPTRLSALAVELIITRLLPLKPDLVILEQQRFRSMGGSSVLEWTLRVNSLESMLYAVFTTLRRLGQWPNGRLEGVVARNVLEFMAVQEGEGATIWAKKGTGDNKRVKKDIVGRMLSSGSGVMVGGEGEGLVGDAVREYVGRWGAQGKRGKAAGGVEGLKKLDDLADCLLQGIAFIRWQENKSRLLQGGVEALEYQMVDE